MPRSEGDRRGVGIVPPPTDLAAQIARLAAADPKALQAEWQLLYGRPPPDDLTPDLVLRGVAHALQLKALGGLAPAVAWQLERLAGATPQPRKRGTLRPGTTLVREWHGETHTVLVHADGFEYRTQLYRSLSLIARAITGAHWSGPRFFGLRKDRPDRASDG